MGKFNKQIKDCVKNIELMNDVKLQNSYTYETQNQYNSTLNSQLKGVTLTKKQKYGQKLRCFTCKTCNEKQSKKKLKERKKEREKEWKMFIRIPPIPPSFPSNFHRTVYIYFRWEMIKRW